MNKLLLNICAVAALGITAQVANAACTDVSRDKLEGAGEAAQYAFNNSGGYGLNMWITMVDETGTVCYVTQSTTQGSSPTGFSGSAWLGSRIISAQKANTANAFSLDGYAISTANLYTPVQPGGSLFGLQASNPIDASRVYGTSTTKPSDYGTVKDPLVVAKLRAGGVNVFGGGLALYKGGKKIGAIGVSGDTSCRDHAFAWEVRKYLNLQPTGSGITTSNMNAAGVVQAPPSDAAQPAGNILKGDEMLVAKNPSTVVTDAYWLEAWSHPMCPNTVTNKDIGFDVGVIELN